MPCALFYITEIFSFVVIINQKVNRKPENQERKADEEDPTVSSKEKKEDPTGPNVTPKQKGEECKLY